MLAFKLFGPLSPKWPVPLGLSQATTSRINTEIEPGVYSTVMVYTLSLHHSCSSLCVSGHKTSSYQHPRHLAEGELLFICRLRHMIISITIVWVKICSRHKHGINFNVVPQLCSIIIHKIFTENLTLHGCSNAKNK